MQPSSDPLGEAIVSQGVTDQPLHLTSQATHHAVPSTSRSSTSSRKHETRDGDGDGDGDDDDDDDDDDLVVFDSHAPLLASPGRTPTKDGMLLAPSSPSRSVRSSTESVSFGFRDNLLPLSLSAGDDDDDDDYGHEAVGLRRQGNYGDVEGTSSSSSAHRRIRRRTRYKDPERRMTLLGGVALTVGLQIGSGIFSSPGVVTLNTGSIGASLVVWVCSGILAWTGASSFAELGAAIPQNGGAQAYLNYSFGPLLSYLFSWTAIVALKPGGGAIIAIIFGEYLARVIFHATTSDLDHPHEQGLEGIPQWSIKLIACLIVIFISALNGLSARLGTRLQIGTTSVKLAAMVAVPILAIVFAARGKMPADSKTAFSSLPALFAGSSTAPSSYALALYSGLWAFDGWDQSCYVAGEMKNVSRDLPRVIHASMSIVLVAFFLTVVSYFLVLPANLVKGTNTIALDFGSAIFGTAGGVVFALLVAFSCFGALNSQVYTSARLVYAAGKEGYLPRSFGQINSRTATPVAATTFQAVLILFFILFGSGFASLVSFYGVCSYTWYFLTVLGLLVLRIKEPTLERPYKAHLPTPVLFATTALFLLVMPVASAPLEALAAVAFMGAGLPAYYLSVGRAREGLVGALLSLCRCGRRGAAHSSEDHGIDHRYDTVDGEGESLPMVSRGPLTSTRPTDAKVSRSTAEADDSPWPPSSLASLPLEASDWTYLAEGGKSLLLRFNGDLDAAKGGWLSSDRNRALALRLLKQGKSDAAVAHEADIDRAKFESSTVAPLLSLSTRNTESPLLLPSRRLGVPEGSRFLHDVVERIESQRPSHRKAADAIDTGSGSLETIEDVTWCPPGGDVLSVEIKPKWLFGEGAVSRYRKHQLLKHREKGRGEMSRSDFENLYEPLDLVSGDYGRVKQAAEGLVRNWQSGGNNLRLFAHGKNVVPGGISDLVPLLRRLDAIDAIDAESDAAALSSLLEKVLYRGDVQSVLASLADLQYNLPPQGLHKSGAILAQMGADAESELMRPPAVEEYAAYVKWWLDEGGRSGTSAPTPRQALLGHLLSATFKDCSLFLRLTPKSGSGSRPESDMDANLDVALHVIDVDAKPVGKLKHWADLEEVIERGWEEWSAAER